MFEWKRKCLQGVCDRMGRVSVQRKVQSELCCGEQGGLFPEDSHICDHYKDLPWHTEITLLSFDPAVSALSSPACLLNVSIFVGRMLYGSTAG